MCYSLSTKSDVMVSTLTVDTPAEHAESSIYSLTRYNYVTLKHSSHLIASTVALVWGSLSMLVTPQSLLAGETTVKIDLVYGEDFSRSLVESLALRLQSRNSRLKVSTLPHSDPEYREFVRVYMYQSFLDMPYLRYAIDNGDLESKVIREIEIHDMYASSPAKPITRSEAHQASLGRVVLHYGNGIDGLERVVAELRQNGVDAITASGGADGRLQILAQRRLLFGYDCCSQDQIANGTATLLARRLFAAKTRHDLKQLLRYIDSGIAHWEAELAGLDRQVPGMEGRLAEHNRRIKAIDQILASAAAGKDNVGAGKDNLVDSLLREYEKQTGHVVDRTSWAESTKALRAYQQILIRERQALREATTN